MQEAIAGHAPMSGYRLGPDEAVATRNGDCHPRSTSWLKVDAYFAKDGAGQNGRRMPSSVHF
jgi:hypothetical protein